MSEAGFSLKIGRLRRGLRHALEARTAALGITAAQFQVLTRLYKQDGQLASALTRDLGATGSTVTGLLDRLEAKGLVRREPVEGDRRARRIRLTVAGQALQAPLAAVLEELDALALAGLEPGEREQFLRTLERVLHNVEDQGSR